MASSVYKKVSVRNPLRNSKPRFTKCCTALRRPPGAHRYLDDVQGAVGVSGQEGVVLPDNSDGNDIGALRGVLASVERVRAAAETDWAALFPSTLPNDGAAAEGDDKNESVRAKGDEDEQQALLRGKLTTALAELGRGLVEREMEVRLLLLAVMAGEHLLLLGPPGTAKSALGRRLSALMSGVYFERLLTRFSVPEELFGPLSMRALEQDQYVRQVQGFLPAADVAFLDEVFKGNSAILNTLLTIVNEGLFDNGSQRIKVPLITMVAASNELPESSELGALYDRFLLRVRVQQTSEAGALRMLEQHVSGGASAHAAVQGTGGDAGGSSASDRPASHTSRHAHGPATSNDAHGTHINPKHSAVPSDSNSPLCAPASRATISRREIAACQRASRRVKVAPSIIRMLAELRSYLQGTMEPPVYVSDRRMLKSMRLLQVAAYCDGRRAVAPHDALLLQHVLWDDPDTAHMIGDWVLGWMAQTGGAEVARARLTRAFAQACSSGSGGASSSLAAGPGPGSGQTRSLRGIGGTASFTQARQVGGKHTAASTCVASLSDGHDSPSSSGQAGHARGKALAHELALLRAELLDARRGTAALLMGGMAPLRSCLWLSRGDAEAAACTLQPRLVHAQADLDRVLFDVVLLQHGMRTGLSGVRGMSLLLPHLWADFIRHGDLADVAGLGTRPLARD